MLLKITDKCMMNCTHCLDDARPDNHNFMDYDTFIKAIDFFNKYGGQTLIISGGEPTEHPYFWMFLEYALDFVKSFMGIDNGSIVVTTNGMNLTNDIVYSKIKEYEVKYNHKLLIQVTHVDKYYPIKIDLQHKIFSLDSVYLCREIESMYPQGRAVTNNIPIDPHKCNKCFNYRSVTRAYKDLKRSAFELSLRGKFCTPSISPNGEIKMGESRLCPVASNIYKTESEIVEDICNFKCNNCGYNKNLTKEYLEAVGEI